MNRNTYSIVGIIVGIIVVISAFAIFGSSNGKQAPMNVQPTPSSGNKPLQIETFYLDETGQPLTDESTESVLDRNEARLDAMIQQIDSDTELIDQLDKAL